MLNFINDDLDIGDDVIYSKIFDVMFNVGDWVLDVDTLRTGTTPSPAGTTNIVIADDEESQTTIPYIVFTYHLITPP